jgi:hypothetical protein
MKLIIQIPCYNEVETLPLSMHGQSSALPGKDVNEDQVIDHTNTDLTAEVAQQATVHHVIYLPIKRLADIFIPVIEACLMHGADSSVSTDADNQCNVEDIQHRVGPVLTGRDQLVVGDHGLAIQ